MSLPRQLTWILAIACVATLGTVLLHPGKPAWFRTVSAEELRWQIDTVKAVELLRAGPVLLVDARSRAKFEEDHLEGAILLNQAEWADLMFEHMDRLQDAMQDPVIVYCDGSDCARSSAVAQPLRELIGLDPVYVLKGDWRSLREAVSGAPGPGSE